MSNEDEDVGKQMLKYFFNGAPSEKIFIAQPQGFKNKGNKLKLYRSNSVPYVLQQASRDWNAHFQNSGGYEI